jgi:hypothetical protein
MKYIYHDSKQNQPQNTQSGPSFNQYTSVKTDSKNINKNNIKYSNYIIKDNGKISDNDKDKLNNNIENITITHAPQAIRQFKFNIFTGKFNPGYPNTITYPVCNQKVSTVFINSSSTKVSSSTANTSTTYPMQNVSSLVVGSDLDSCVECIPINYTGEYLLNWSITDGPQLLSSTNPQIVLGTFEYYVNDDYFEIFLYPTTDVKNNSYIHIRYRVPIRWRYDYNDWTFWENVLLTGEMSETEFVRIVNCCDNFKYIN